MPNPLKTLNSLSKTQKGRLMRNSRQKALVKRLRAAGLPVRVYKRRGSPTGVSVHNPFVDVQKKAKLGNAQRFPQAFDTKVQRRTKKKRRMVDKRLKRKKTKAGAKQGRIKKKAYSYRPQLLP